VACPPARKGFHINLCLLEGLFRNKHDVFGGGRDAGAVYLGKESEATNSPASGQAVLRPYIEGDKSVVRDRRGTDIGEAEVTMKEVFMSFKVLMLNVIGG